MADMKYINDLPEQTEAPDDAEVFVIQGNETKKIPWGKIKEYVGSGMPVVEITMEEYKKLSDEEKNMEVLYLVTDLDSFDASNISYEGSVAATNVADALDVLGGLIDDIGLRYQITGESVSVANNTQTSIASLTLPIGRYIAQVGVNFGAKSGGIRKVKLGSSETDFSNARCRVATAWVSGDESPCMLNVTSILNVTIETTIYANVLQTSGASLNCSAQIQAIRLQ